MENPVLFAIILIAVVVAVIFSVAMIKKSRIRLIHKLFFVTIGVIVISLIDLMLLFFLEGNHTAEMVIDAISNISLLVPVLILCVSLTFTRGWEKLPKFYWALFIIPAVSFLLVCTNPIHHLIYKTFSINRAEIEFGPCFFISGLYLYICFLLSMGVIGRFVFNKANKPYRPQAILFAIGNIIPMIVSLAATVGLLDAVNIYSTPLSYILAIIIFHGLAIFKFNLLDIQPLAIEVVLSKIPDGYLVLNERGLVVNLNNAFKETIGAQYCIKLRTNIFDCATDTDINADIGIHTLTASITSCKETGAAISYEQSLTLTKDGAVGVKYYLVDVTGLKVDNKNVGFVVLFRDISKLKESAKELHNNQVKMMEREQLAFLGQMLGGMSHNLKTPIMSISGSLNAVSKLINEAENSLDDNDVTGDDYREIYSEMSEWIVRVQEACAYMSDIITAVKGQATTFNAANREAEFTLDHMVKRVSLLLRHELQVSKCSLKVNNLIGKDVRILGDINSMVQVINNLITNSICAMKDKGGEIKLEIDKNSKDFLIKVIDTGEGIPEHVRPLLLQQMITSKGAQGSGLGIYMSKSFIKARFDGSISFEDNPGGGTIFIVSIPLKSVEIMQTQAAPMSEPDN